MSVHWSGQPMPDQWNGRKPLPTYLPPVRGRSGLVALPHFVEVILIQLTDEAGKVAVLEMLRENCVCKLFILRIAVNNKFISSLTVTGWATGAYL